MVDLSFYHDIGQNAFSGLDSFRPFEFNMHGFYQKVSANFCIYYGPSIYSVKRLLEEKSRHVSNKI